MNLLAQTDWSFPAWLTLTSVWEETMEDPESIKTAIARNVRTLREKRGLSRRALARLSHSTVAEVRNTESARAVPTIGLIWRLARSLDVPCEALLALEGAS